MFYEFCPTPCDNHVFLFIKNWMQDKEEVQLVDMVLRIRNKLTEATDQKLPVPDVVSQQLTSHVDTILKTLPHDLQLVLRCKMQ